MHSSVQPPTFFALNCTQPSSKFLVRPSGSAPNLKPGHQVQFGPGFLFARIPRIFHGKLVNAGNGATPPPIGLTKPAARKERTPWLGTVRSSNRSAAGLANRRWKDVGAIVLNPDGTHIIRGIRAERNPAQRTSGGTPDSVITTGPEGPPVAPSMPASGYSRGQSETRRSWSGLKRHHGPRKVQGAEESCKRPPRLKPAVPCARERGSQLLDLTERLNDRTGANPVFGLDHPSPGELRPRGSISAPRLFETVARSTRIAVRRSDHPFACHFSRPHPRGQKQTSPSNHRRVGSPVFDPSFPRPIAPKSHMEHDTRQPCFRQSCGPQLPSAVPPRV